MPKLNRTFSPIGLACAAVILTSLYGCAPLVVGGVASTSALVATDRRTAGAQLDHQTIELKIGSDKIGRAHVCTPVPNAHLVCRLRLAKKPHHDPATPPQAYQHPH